MEGSMNTRRLTDMCGCTCGSSGQLAAVIATATMMFGVGCDSATAPAPKAEPVSQRSERGETSLAAEPADSEPVVEEPVVWSAVAVPATVAAGTEFVLEVRARIAPGWGIQPMGGAAGGPSLPTTIELELPTGVEAVGDWKLPTARRLIDKPGTGAVHEGVVTFRRALKIVAGQQVGPLEVGCEVGFQACDAEFCRRPEKVALVVTVRVVE